MDTLEREKDVQSNHKKFGDFSRTSLDQATRDALACNPNPVRESQKRNPLGRTVGQKRRKMQGSCITVQSSNSMQMNT